MNNYRHISIVPVLSNIFEKLYLTRMFQFSNQCIQPCINQFRCRMEKLIINKILSHAEMIVIGLECPIQSVFIKLSKAFACVDHAMFLNKLNRHGVPGVTLLWLSSFLIHSSQIVRISNHFSKSRKMSAPEIHS